jgi:hypothetical protein
MSNRDWQILVEIPPEWDMLNDIKDWMLKPYSQKDLEKHKEITSEEF